MAEEKVVEKEVVEKPKPRPITKKKGVPAWIILFITSMVYLIISVIVFFMVDASVSFIIGFYVISFIVLLLIIGAVMIYKKVTKKGELSVARTKEILEDEMLKGEAENYMFEMRSVQAGRTKFFGIKPVKDDAGNIIRVFGWLSETKTGRNGTLLVCRQTLVTNSSSNWKRSGIGRNTTIS